ncbi:MAG: TolC family protein, partial [Myxococcales bacterium]|nr:TolC family protein [Myxococcales bacterium]
MWWLLMGLVRAETLSVDDALGRLADAAPAMRGLDGDLRGAEASVSQARALSDPTLQLQATRYSAPASIAASWTLPSASYGGSLRAAADEREATRADVALAALTLQVGVERAWTDLWAAERRLALART